MSHWFYLARGMMWLFIGSVPVIVAANNEEMGLPALIFQWVGIWLLYNQVIK